MTKQITIMLVEDNPEYRKVISLALKKDPNLTLVSNAGTAERAISYLHGISVSEYPSLILLDLNLPGMSGLDAMPLFQKQAPNAKIIILTQSDRESDVLNAIKRGASGYLLKSSTISQIKQGIHTVMEGGASLDSKMAKYILAFFQSQLSKNSTKHALTDREMEVLSMLGEGKVKKEIAETLDVSFFTVASHIRKIYEKLNVTNAPAAITKAYRTGLFPSGDAHWSTERAEQLKTVRVRIVAEEARKAKQAVSTDLDQKTKELQELQDVLKVRDEKLAKAQQAQAELIKNNVSWTMQNAKWN